MEIPSHEKCPYVVEELARTRLLPFVMKVYQHLNPHKPALKPSWYLMAMCFWLERVANGELPRSMIWLQPRALKSITVAVAFPCWLLGRDPSTEIMVGTYGDGLARQHGDHRRSVIEAAWYRQLFPATKIERGSNRADEIVTTAKGRCLIITPKGRSTGSGADYVILDDIMKADEANSDTARAAIKLWIDATVTQRLNPYGRNAIVSIQQRLHEDDAPAYLLDKGYKVLCLPAVAQRDLLIDTGPGQQHMFCRGDLLCPDLMSREKLDAKKAESGSQVYSSQYLQDPVAPDGNLLRIEHFRRFEMEIPRERFEKMFISIDTATSTLPTADWTVFTVWGYLAGRMFLQQIYRKRLEYYDLKKTVIALHARWRPDRVIVEDANNGTGLIQEFNKSGPFPLYRFRPKGDKVQRVIAQTGQIEEGRVWLPAELDGLEEMLHELRGFPFCRHDDIVDSMTQMLQFSLDHWKFAETLLGANGRKEFVMRERKRPALPPIPEWIY